MSQPTPLGQYILALLERHKMSMREASLKAGLSDGLLRQWIYNAKLGRPRPENILAVSESIGGDYTEMLRLAGHPLPAGTTADPAYVRSIFERIDNLERDNPTVAQRVIDAINLLLDAAEIVNAGGPLNDEQRSQQSSRIAPPVSAEQPDNERNSRNRQRAIAGSGSGNADGADQGQ